MNFTAREAKTLTREHRTLLDQLAGAANSGPARAEAVRTAAEGLREAGVRALLAGIPVEELNRARSGGAAEEPGRGRSGIRVKYLHDSGIHNVADARDCSLRQLTDIKGISADGAVTIRRLAAEFADEARRTQRLRLDADRRTPEATALVRAVSARLRTAEAIRFCHDSFWQNSQPVTRALDALAPAAGLLRRLFASGAEKARAEEAYNYLNEQWNGAYRNEAVHALLTIAAAEEMDDAAVWEDFIARPIEFFAVLEELVPGLLATDRAEYGLPEDLAQAVRDEPVDLEGLRCTLRRYQLWGVKYILNRKRVLLGDEMGLGKTVQAIAAMVSLRNGGATHFLVVCPAGVLTNWLRELPRHSELRALRVHGPDREDVWKAWLDGGGVAVTTYETAARLTLPADFPGGGLLTVDEAHYIKNPAARRSRAVRGLSERFDRVLYMTGTALENRVDEMLSLLRPLQPELAAELSGMAFLSSAPQFREAAAPVYYRRRREEVLTELPELIESREWCVLSPAEAERYEAAVRSRDFTAARRVSWTMPDLTQSCKARRLLELIDEAAEDGRRVLVFSFFLDTLFRTAELLGSRALPPLHGGLSPARRQELVDQFEASPAGSVLAAQIQAGGTGLNLQSASVVVICEPQFKPSAERQAISRAYRMGQARSVLVYRLLCADTVDERITQILEQKQAVFDAFADRSAAAEESRALDEAGFAAIMDEELRRIEERKGA
ncbi:MAG: DEAD/DEAH box helicase [Oscillospiraceae bacterium]|nr:DEAD/DEAH box helicase [Oscillospiraceae bacterium]